MGTLYDLLGALPRDDAEALRAAFRKAAKATHPDTNPDNPDAALRFRELVRAYDILTDAEQRAAYDQLLAIALQPPAAKGTRTYETVRKLASNTMAATLISALLVGGYSLSGMFSTPPEAAEIAGDITVAMSQEAAAAMQAEASSEETARAGDVQPAVAEATSVVLPAARDAVMGAIGRFEAVPAFATYNLGIQYYPRFATGYFDRGLILYRTGDFEGAFAHIAPVSRPRDGRRAKIPTPLPRRPPPGLATASEKRVPIASAVTP